jgi:hypothetical protein
MGPVGAIVGQEIGGVAGREGATMIAKKLGAGKNGQEIARNIGNGVGRLLGGATGGFLSPFDTGGVVGKGKKRGSPVPILAHAGEVVLPLNAHVTKAQMKTIEKNVRLQKKKTNHRFK